METPTWHDERRLPLAVVRQYVFQDLEELREREERTGRERAELEASVLAKLGGGGRRRQEFLRELDWARRFAAVMEDHNFYIEQLTSAVVRRGVMEIGRRMAAAGAIGSVDDLFHLTGEELASFLRGDSQDLRGEVEARQAQWNLRCRMTPPPLLGASQGEATTPVTPDLGEGVIRGTPASAGTGRGRARIVRGTELVPMVEPGEVLVAVNAGPLWTPVFPVLGGLVLDAGVIFQHAASIAREYGVPAVIETKAATRWIREGQMVTVDGTQGLVFLGTE